MREEAEAQRRKVETREQEAFAAQYQNVGLQEELETIKQQLKKTEDERDALKTSLREEEVARIAAEGKIALPVSRENDQSLSPKKASPRKSRESVKENRDPFLDPFPDPFEPEESEEEMLRIELAWERRITKRLEDKIHFMNMECQFKRCSCRIAEMKGVEFVHDGRFNKIIADHEAAAAKRQAEKQKSESNPVKTEDGNLEEPHSKPPTAEPAPAPTPVQSPISSPMPKPEPGDAEPPHLLPEPEPEQSSETLVRFSPTSGTFSTAPAAILPSSPTEVSPTSMIPQTPTALLRFSPQLPNLSLSQAPPESSLPASPPAQQQQQYPTTPRPLPFPPTNTSAFMSRTTTTTVPLAVPPSPFTPNATMSREEALEQIRQRRGRARSVAAGQATPRKQMVDLSSLRRDISAPAGRNG